jgi:spore coat polysaccharide biosynthesis protein SpsF (cytidylyltransferase family)
MSIKVTIGIQARSTSTRLPNKIELDLFGTTVLKRVIDICKNVEKNVNRYQGFDKPKVNLVLLVPEGDPVARKYRGLVDVLEGPEHDVLSRYVAAQSQYSSDYLVRVTADCPFHVPLIITKHITVAVMNQYDYLSNVDERFRTAPDGHDCEVISKRLLEHLGTEATEAFDREHVTTLARSSPPEWARMGFMINRLDQSGLKISLDTEEDAERIRDEMKRVEAKFNNAERTYGKGHVHSFA